MMKALLLTVALTGCGTTATIQTFDGRVYDGRISGHDGGRIFINGTSVEREAVTDIDHPGNVAAVLGTIVAGIGALGAVGNCSEEKRAEDPTPCTSSGIWLLTGIPIAVYGLITHSESVDRAGQ